MDICKNKTMLQTYLKDFTLKTTASTLLALHAEVGMAQSCTPVISGSTLATVICDFIPSTGSSVTVEQNGTVGGIAMVNYPGSASFIQINAGGLVNAGTTTPTTINIAVKSSILTNGITNSGTISNTAQSNTGINISASSTIGGIVNDGTIQSSGTGSIGISLLQSAINNNGITNTGTISSNLATAILIQGDNVTGNIVNTGTIHAGTNGEGIYIGNSRGTTSNYSNIFGSISNSGLITASGNGDGLGIRTSSNIYGGITNSGQIISTENTAESIFGATIAGSISNTATLSGAVGGLVINATKVEGNISNTGSIVGAQLTSSHTGTRVFHAGVVLSNLKLLGSLSNSGTITGSRYEGLSILYQSTLNGSITNTGTITGATEGVRINGDSTVEGNIFNYGTISGNDIGFQAYDAPKLQGGLYNYGTITGGQTGLQAQNTGSFLQIGQINNIVNSGTITGASKGISIANSITIQGGITNSGMISSNTTGIKLLGLDAGAGFQPTLVEGITNSGTITGDTNGISIESQVTLNNGISNSGTIQGNTYAINIDPNSTVNNLDITGKNAHIIGAVVASNTAVNVENGATFTSEGTYDVSSFNIASDATFNMANLITAPNFNNSGTFILSNTQTLNATTYQQDTGGVFQTNVSSLSNYGQLNTTSTVDLSQSGNIYVQLESGANIQNGDVLSNVITGTSFTLPSAGFQVSDNSFLLNFSATLNQTNTALTLTASLNPNAYSACQNTYCQGAANVILDQVAAGNTLFSSYALLTTSSAFQQAASQATPELTNENIQLVQVITRAVEDVVPMWGSLHGKSAGDAMLYQPGKVWVKPYGATMTQNLRTTVNGFDATAYGAVIGKDISLRDDVLFGVAFAAGGDRMHGKSVLSGQSINSNAYQGIVYASKKLPNQLYAAGQGLAGYEINHTSRAIPLYTTTAEGTYNSWFTNVRGEAGWRNEILKTHVIFTPEIDASYLYIHQGSYRESGSPMNLAVATNQNASLVLGAYGNGAYHLKELHDNHDLTLAAYAGVAKDVLNNQPQTLATFVASGATFSTFGVQFNGVVFRGGASLTLTKPTKPLILELNYDAQVGNNAYSNIGAATLKYKLS